MHKKIIIDDDFLSKDSKNYIDTFILGDSFPFYINPNSVGKDGHMFLYHVAVKRHETRGPKEHNFSSSEGMNLINLLNDFIEKNKISCGRILRCAVNLSFNNGYKRTLSHKDHDIDHKVLIIYCNDVLNTPTVIEENDKIIKKVEAKKYRGLYFENYTHYMVYPKEKHRVVVVYTFK